MTQLYELIDSYNDYIKKIPAGCQQIAGKLREDKIAEAMQYIVDFSEGANWLSQACLLLQKNGVVVDLDTEKIHEYLNDINCGLEIQDFIVVADMFEYEVLPFFEGKSRDVKQNS